MTTVPPFGMPSTFLQTAVNASRARLSEANQELVSGRKSELAARLGDSAGTLVSLRQVSDQLTSINENNTLVKTRLDVTQAGLQAVGGVLENFIESVIAVRDSAQPVDLSIMTAKQSLSSFAGIMNSTHNGYYLFGGLNGDVAPIHNFEGSPPPANQQAVIDAFTNAFGVPPGSDAAKNITPAMMQAFLDGPFTALFDEPNWTTTWSAASSTNRTALISPSEHIDASVNANEAAVKKVAQAFTMVAALGLDKLSAVTRDAVLDAAIGEAQVGVSTLAQLQGKVGLGQVQLEQAIERNELSSNIVLETLSSMERADPYQLSIEISDLITKIEMSYAATARIQQLNIMNYI